VVVIEYLGRSVPGFVPGVVGQIVTSSTTRCPWCRRIELITIFLWDRDLDYRENPASYWVIIWGIWPVFGLIQGVYSFSRLL
jgi:hypothetical protein